MLNRADPPMCVGLYARWGSGKTFMISLLKKEFDPTVRELLRGFWLLTDADQSGGIDRDEYLDLHLHLYAAMNAELRVESQPIQDTVQRECSGTNFWGFSL